MSQHENLRNHKIKDLNNALHLKSENLTVLFGWNGCACCMEINIFLVKLISVDSFIWDEHRHCYKP